MMEFNPLNILGKREVSTMPSHFSKIKLDTKESFYIDDERNKIRTWVSSKLKGRYSIKKLPAVGLDGRMRSEYFIGFEDHKELTYFILACPHIRR